MAKKTTPRSVGGKRPEDVLEPGESAIDPKTAGIVKRKRGRGRPRRIGRDPRQVEHERAKQKRREANRAMASAAYCEALERSGKPAPNPPGRKKRFEPVDLTPTPEQRAQVQTMAGIGLRHDEIALLVINPDTGVPIDEKTLKKHFERELAKGPAMSTATVAQSLYTKAQGDSHQAVTAAIFWLKCRAGWTERTVVEVENKSGVLVPPAQMTPEQWIAAAAAANAAKEEPGGED